MLTLFPGGGYHACSELLQKYRVRSNTAAIAAFPPTVAAPPFTTAGRGRLSVLDRVRF